MFETIGEMLKLSFVNRAIIVGSLVSLCAALLGVSLVLKRYSNIGDGLSHVGFGITTVAVGLGATSTLPIAIPVVIIVAILLLKVGNNHKIKSDSAIAIISSSALAIGVAVTSVTSGLNTDICNFMFGSILAMSISDVILSIAVSIIVLVLFVVYYRKLFAVTFDEDYSKAIGLKTGRYTNLIAILTAIVIVVGMRMMGTLLISSIIIFPALTAMKICKSYKRVVIGSGVISVFCFLVGIFLSYVYNISTGAMIVIVNMILFLLFTFLDKLIKE